MGIGGERDPVQARQEGVERGLEILQSEHTGYTHKVGTRGVAGIAASHVVDLRRA